MKMLTKRPAVTEMVIELCPNPKAISVSVASRRAAQVALVLAGRYQNASKVYTKTLKQAAQGEIRLPVSATVVVSPCFDFSAVVEEFRMAANSIEDGFAEELPFPPSVSSDMYLKIIGTKSTGTLADVILRAVHHGYFLGLSDAAHSIQDDVAVAPYAGHTAKEMVGILQSFYTDSEGNERKFLTRIINSEDPRLNRMSRMAIEIFFSMLERESMKCPTENQARL